MDESMYACTQVVMYMCSYLLSRVLDTSFGSR